LRPRHHASERRQIFSRLAIHAIFEAFLKQAHRWAKNCCNVASAD
jgi:hypothetical protein